MSKYPNHNNDEMYHNLLIRTENAISTGDLNRAIRYINKLEDFDKPAINWGTYPNTRDFLIRMQVAEILKQDEKDNPTK